MENKAQDDDLVMNLVVLAPGLPSRSDRKQVIRNVLFG
jgi:hypothetical protein